MFWIWTLVKPRWERECHSSKKSEVRGFFIALMGEVQGVLSYL